LARHEPLIRAALHPYPENQVIATMAAMQLDPVPHAEPSPPIRRTAVQQAIGTRPGIR
jgi:hypothetical protein